MREHPARIEVTGEESTGSYRVSADLLLCEVADRVDLSAIQRRLVEDDGGRLIGIIDAADIQMRLESPHERECDRWAATPIETLITARLDAVDGLSLVRDPDGNAEIPGTAICSTERMLAMDVGNDVLVPWSSVRGVLQRALFDAVTGLPNRAVFNRHLAEEWERVQRRNSSIAVLMIDLDYFKEINDQHGHSRGDEVLRAVAQTLATQLRSYDLLARFGGDEFAAILTDCYMTDIHIPASRLHAGILKVRQELNLGDSRLSISMGAITCPGSRKKTRTELIDAADECLYAAKAAGRNCAYTLDLALSDKAKPRLLPAGRPAQPRTGARVPRPR